MEKKEKKNNKNDCNLACTKTKRKKTNSNILMMIHK